MADIFVSLQDLEERAKPIISSLTSPTILNKQQLQDSLIDDLIFTAEFSDDDTTKMAAAETIRKIAPLLEINSTSTYSLYKAFGEKKIDGFTVPALNIRTLTYDISQMVFELMQTHQIGAVIFELARGEIDYTHQRPAEYLTAILAGAIKVGYTGPVFILGDHYQFSQKKFTEDKQAEIEAIQSLIKESLTAGYGNIDIDASTLVDLSLPRISDQQKHNSEMTALMTNYIREIEPEGQTTAIGGEIGHIGDRNSTVEDFEAFIEEYRKLVHTVGISKVSVQTGTSHGGTVLPDGTFKDVAIDFNVLKTISTLARDKYEIGGAVQHGASTLPDTAFDHFVENKTLEVHLATGLQNIVYDNLPSDVRQEIYSWITENLSEERQPEWNDEQFIYKTRKKALGPFKELLWSMSQEEKEPILRKLEEHLEIIFKKLNLTATRDKVHAFYQ